MALLVLWLCGCVSLGDKIRRHAAFEMHCDEAQLTMIDLGDNVFGVRGCGNESKCRDIPFVGIDCKRVAPPAAPSASR
jgi:hypothetical protein